MKKSIITIIVVFLLLLLVSCNLSKLEIEPPYITGNEPMNSNQFGFVAKESDWFYYIDGENNHDITRTNGIIKETYENTYARGLNLYGDYIYFASHSSDFVGSSGFYRVHKDNPKDIEKVHSHHTNMPIIVNDYIFYSIFYKVGIDGLYRSKVDGSDQVQLVEEMINGLQWYDGWIYYAVSSGGHVYKMRPSGDDKVQLRTKHDIAISTTNFLVDREWIYFENRDDTLFYSLYAEDSSTNIFRLSLVDGSVEGLAEGRLHLIDKSSEYLYFSSNENPALFRMNIDGSNPTEIYRGEKNWNWINIIDDTLYLLDWNTDDHTYLYRFNPDKEDLSLINY